MNRTDNKIIFIVIGSIAFLASVYLATMAYCIIAGIKPDASIGQAFNHAGDVLLGALIGVLAKTSVTTAGNEGSTPVTITNTPGEPVQTTINNPPDQPVPVTDQHVEPAP